MSTQAQALRVIAIDGPAGSGKSTLSEQVSDRLGGAPVVHMDDLYRGWDQELGAPLANRIVAWLLDAWAAGLPGRHLRYDWHAGRYTEWVEVVPAPVAILEGCGSASRELRARASCVVWVEAPEDARLQRGLARDPAQRFQGAGELVRGVSRTLRQRRQLAKPEGISSVG